MCKPPLLPAWYGLARICRAAGLVMLVSSWARLGSGSRPFLLLRIWRVKKAHRSEGKRPPCVCRVCVLVWPPAAPDDYVNYCTSLHHQGLSALPTEMWGRGEITLRSAVFALKCFHLFCCQRCSWMCDHTPTRPDVNLQADICRFNLLFSSTYGEFS